MTDAVSTDDIRARLGLRPIINVSGTMTSLGASIVVPAAVEAVAAILPQFVEMGDLQKRASRTIARLTGAEAGFVTASCAAAITLAVAGTMTGDDLAAIERLPDTSRLPRDEVVIQSGHMVGYGAPVEQGIRLSGAKVVPVGQATSAEAYQLAGAITERTAAALYVVSHHTVQYGQMSLEEFTDVAHAQGVPVIVDAASEYDLKRFLAAGADLVLYSSHKFLGGPDRRYSRRAQGSGARRLLPEQRHRPRHEGRQGGRRRHDRGAGGLGNARPCWHPRPAKPPRSTSGGKRCRPSPASIR